MTVQEMLQRISSRELTEWAVYEEKYGILGPQRGDFQAARVAQTVATVNAGSKGGSLTLDKFLIQWESNDAEVMNDGDD